ncbi:hypothetical protein B0I37DRAFT_164930 [Chaetomium sp. MPI-CAGE-AT-0009]|nr:hypothetical protein B0I37DRAFT_164930 [Chaetomium sp. MPI-CAGE-AT-0009]
MGTTRTRCTICNMPRPEVVPKRCANCSAENGSVMRYCSRSCQIEDWEAHKKVCGTKLSPRRRLDQPIDKPFTRLANGTWLHDRPEKDVYRILIDAYRLRALDDHTAEGGALGDSQIYGGVSSQVRGFRRFLRFANSLSGLLPPWWDAEKRLECESFAMGPSRFQYLRSAVNSGAIMKHYYDARFPLQLRILAEEVYGCAAGGQDTTGMTRRLAMAENGR